MNLTRREHGDRPRLDRRLPRGPEAHSRTCASCRCTSASATRASATTSTSARTTSTAAASRPELPTTSQPTPAGLPRRCTSELGGVRADLRTPALGEAVRHVPERVARRCGGRCRRCASSTPRRRRSASGCSRWRSRTLLARGTTDEEIEALVERFHREQAGILFTVDTLEYLAKGGRIGRAQALAGRLLNVKPIIASTTARSSRWAGCAGARRRSRSSQARSTPRRRTAPGCGVAIAHADAPEWVEQLRSILRHERVRRREVELVTNLGAVVGTHAGPGTVGFFWFQD